MALKQLTPSLLKRIDIAHNTYTIHLPPEYTLEDALNPVFWAHIVPPSGVLRKLDLIRIVAHDFSYDITVTVVALLKGGAHVQISPRIPSLPEAGSKTEIPYIRGKLAVRVEYTKATNWRVIGLDQSEFASGFETKEAAEAAMKGYMAELNLVLPKDPPPAPVKSPSVAKDKDAA